MGICYLHIGPNKTATTTLQLLLVRNVEQLAGHGVFVPHRNAINGAHHAFAREICEGASTDHQERLAAEIAAAAHPPAIVISSEFFSGIREPAGRSRLVRFFSGLGYELRPIAYIRPQIDLVNSHFTQKIKRFPPGLQFDQFFEHFLARPLSDYLWRFRPLLKDHRFRPIFAPFPSASAGPGICTDFLTRLGLSPAAIASCAMPESRNVSPGAKTVAAMMHVAEQITRLPRRPSLQALWLARVEMTSFAERIGWIDRRFNGLRSQQKTRILEHFQRSNESFAERVWDSSWSSRFARDESEALRRERNCYEPDDALPDERRVFNSVCAVALDVISRGVPDPKRLSERKQTERKQTPSKSALPAADA